MATPAKVQKGNRPPQELCRFEASIFQGLAHPTRVAIVEALREGEMSAGELIDRLGVAQANASQHLSVLRSKRILVNRKKGNQVFYSLCSPALLDVLDALKHYFGIQLNQMTSILDHMNAETRALRRRSRNPGSHSRGTR